MRSSVNAERSHRVVYLSYPGEVERMRWDCTRIGVRALLLLFLCAAPAALILAGAVAPAAADEAPNFVIICADEAWIGAFSPLKAYLEADWDWEGDRAWKVEVIALSDSSTVRAALAAYHDALQQSGGGDLFAMIVEDPSQSSLIPQRMIYDPEVAGADIGWGDYVPSDDLYCDLGDDGTVEVITFRLPAQTVDDCEAYVEKDLNVRFNLSLFSQGGLAGASQTRFARPEAVKRAPELETRYMTWTSNLERLEMREEEAGSAVLEYLSRADVICEDFDREGRSGDLVRQHGQAIVGLWGEAGFDTCYQGDDHPYDYFAREADADSLDNRGHQFKITYGTIANKVNLIDFQDQRMDPPWGVDHLEANYCYPLHLALSCAHHAVDRPDGPSGRAHSEQVAFLTDRGAFASLGYTRQVRAWSAYWMGEALTNVLLSHMAGCPQGATVGRAWRGGKNAFLAAHPEHANECASFCGFGDPTLCVVEPQPLVAVPEGKQSRRLTLDLSRSPFGVGGTIRYALPRAQRVELVIYDALGRKVRELVPLSFQAADEYRVSWDGRNDQGKSVASGVYFVRLGNRSEVLKAKKLVFVR